MISHLEHGALHALHYQAPGVSTAAKEMLLTCPCCGTANFSARGLSAHCCRAKPDRGRLTLDELQRARQRAK